MDDYGTLTLLDTSPSGGFTEPILVEEVRRGLNLPERSPADDGETLELEFFISAAREQAELLQGRDLVRKQWMLTLDYLPAEIRLRSPLVSVDLFRYRDSGGTYAELTSNTQYIVDTRKQPGRVMPAYGTTWPSFTAWPTGAVEITFTSGYAPTDVYWNSIGSLVKRGMLYLITSWYTNRLPFEIGYGAASEYPYTLSQCLLAGALHRSP